MTEAANDTFHIGFALSGAVSAGAYTAGVLDFFFQALNEWEKARGVAGTPEHRVDIQVVTGASAGAITGALGVVALARGIRPQKLSVTEKQNTHPIVSMDGLERLRDQTAWSHEAFRRGRIRALCEIAHGRPDHANPIVRNMTPAANLPLQEAQLLELQGELAAAQYDARAAASLLEHACQRYIDAHFETEANEVRLKRLRVVKDQIGDWRLVRDLLKSFNDKARLFDRLAPLVAVEAAHFSSLTGDRDLPFLDHQFAAIARTAEPEKHVDGYLSLLEGIQPEGVRYPLLRIFAALPVGGRPPILTRDLAAIVPLPGTTDPDYIPKVLGVIDMLGFINRSGSHVWLRAALNRDQPSLLPLLLDAAERLEADLPSVETVRQCLAQAGMHGFGFAAAVKYVRLALDRSKPQIAEKVSGMLTQVPEELRGTQFEALHNLNIARRPDLKKRARRQARRSAAEILRQLGQDKAVAEILETPHVIVNGNSGLPRHRRVRTIVALDKVSLDWRLGSNRELVSYELARRLADSAEDSIAALKQALAEWELTPKVGVELNIDNAPAAMVPWEWALGDHDVCYRSSARLPAPRSSISRMIGTMLHHRPRRFFSFFQPLRVIILRPSISSQESRGRGFEVHSRRPLTAIYATHGARAIEPKGLEAEDVRQAMSGHNPDVVHIQAAVVERRRSLQLDLPVRTAVPGPEYLAGLFKEGSRPIVILDPPRPMEEVETVLQLLLRNRFAADLVATGRVRAVLAAGLLRAQDLQIATERLAHRLCSFPLLYQLLEVFRRDIGSDQISGDGAALFASDPDEIVP